MDHTNTEITFGVGSGLATCQCGGRPWLADCILDVSTGDLMQAVRCGCGKVKWVQGPERLRPNRKEGSELAATRTPPGSLGTETSVTRQLKGSLRHRLGGRAEMLVLQERR